MSPSSRAAIVYLLGLITGAALFFLSFAAIFVGSWLMLLLFVLSYAAAGALGVRAGGADPAHLAIALALPAMPWVFWLFPASVSEAGLPRALLWPALVVIMLGSAWLGGKAAAPARR